ncbi:hypothetical protein HSX37_17265|uniref:Phosphoenolpyruvate synthase n=1 Tax=Dendrosporobacter quercicolus TaxID=146817 RepID=A0A1G9ZCR6_9FIRM|nr:phenylalanine--tRNA ligase beta subunit-related protein [Dendrosporobacter quercicolus]NSL49776.1 hypothetical protein [Dendrosporobacter quercicolus DSM 1736]SDN19064.1 phosphoenolpyruvate synthase [Dendrosporobacter quercicolus]
MKVTIDHQIGQLVPKCRLGISVIRDVHIQKAGPEFIQEFQRLQQEIAGHYRLDKLAGDLRIAAVRNMYKKLAFDPGRYRPAAEALVRRVLQNKGVYEINSAVDVNNYCSMKYLLPFGLYDLDQVKGDVLYGVAGPGQYVNIAGKSVSTAGKPCLSDADGVFGNPTADSLRTAVTHHSRNLLSVIYADEEIGDDELNQMIKHTGDMLARYNAGTVGEDRIVYGNSVLFKGEI